MYFSFLIINLNAYYKISKYFILLAFNSFKFYIIIMKEEKKFK